MQTFHSAIVDVIESGDPSIFEGSTELRDQLEAFLEEYCANPPDTDPGPPVQDPLPDGPVPNAQCGSFMFYLLADAAELLGVDWMPVAQPFIDEMEAIAETTELSDMLDLEEVGCEGAQALYDLLVEAGYGDALDGSDLDPYA